MFFLSIGIYRCINFGLSNEPMNLLRHIFSERKYRVQIEEEQAKFEKKEADFVYKESIEKYKLSLPYNT